MPLDNGRMDLATLLGQRIRDLGLTNTDVGNELGVDEATVSRWRRGTAPRPGKVEALAKFLQLPEADVLGAIHLGRLGKGSDPTEDRLSALEEQVAELRGLVEELLERRRTPEGRRALGEGAGQGQRPPAPAQPT